MSDETLEKIKQSHENIALTLGTIFSLILIAYFLSYSALANSNYTSLFWFEMISSIFIVLGLFYIQRIAFSLLGIRFMGNADCKQALQSLSLQDLKK